MFWVLIRVEGHPHGCMCGVERVGMVSKKLPTDRVARSAKESGRTQQMFVIIMIRSSVGNLCTRHSPRDLACDHGQWEARPGLLLWLTLRADPCTNATEAAQFLCFAPAATFIITAEIGWLTAEYNLLTARHGFEGSSDTACERCRDRKCRVVY